MHFSPFLLLCLNHLHLEFTKILRPKPFAGVPSHTCADKIDHFIHKNNNFIYNLRQLTAATKATIPGTLCSLCLSISELVLHLRDGREVLHTIDLSREVESRFFFGLCPLSLTIEGSTPLKVCSGDNSIKLKRL